MYFNDNFQIRKEAKARHISSWNILDVNLEVRRKNSENCPSIKYFSTS